MDQDVDTFISVIMPAYNAERYIEKSIVSVRNQTFKNWELIIVDDGSTDKTSLIIEGFRSMDCRIKYIYQQNKKQAAARNRGVAEAKGKWIAFLDSDDIWLYNKLEEQFKYVAQINADVFYTQGVIIDENNSITSDYEPACGYFTGAKMYKRLYKGNPIPILSVVLKKEWVSKVGNQNEDEKMAGCEDWDYWIRLAKAGAGFYGIESKLFKYRIHAKGTSMNTLQMKIAETYALYNNYDPSCFSYTEMQHVKSRFILLIRSIIPNLYITKNKEAIIFFFSIIYSITGLFKYRIGNFIFNVFGYKSKRAVTFLLFH